MKIQTHVYIMLQEADKPIGSHIFYRIYQQLINDKQRKISPKCYHWRYYSLVLTHLPIMPHICHWIGSALVQIMAYRLFGAIILTTAGLLSFGPLWTNLSEILIKMQIISFTKMHLKISSGKCRLFCPGGDELSHQHNINHPYFTLNTEM